MLGLAVLSARAPQFPLAANFRKARREGLSLPFAKMECDVRGCNQGVTSCHLHQMIVTPSPGRPPTPPTYSVSEKQGPGPTYTQGEGVPQGKAHGGHTGVTVTLWTLLYAFSVFYISNLLAVPKITATLQRQDEIKYVAGSARVLGQEDIWGVGVLASMRHVVCGVLCSWGCVVGLSVVASAGMACMSVFGVCACGTCVFVTWMVYPRVCTLVYVFREAQWPPNFQLGNSRTSNCCSLVWSVNTRPASPPSVLICRSFLMPHFVF